MMKYLLICSLLLISSSFHIPQKEEIFCCEVYPHDIPKSIGDYQYIKFYRIDFRHGARKFVRYTVVVSKNTEYMLKLVTKSGKMIRAEVELDTTMQHKRKPITTYETVQGQLKSYDNQTSSGKYMDEIRFKPKNTGIGFITFTDPHADKSLCVGAGLFFVPKEDD